MAVKHHSKKFNTVFAYLDILEEIKSVFKNTHVENIKIQQNKQNLEITLKSNKKISKNHIDKLEKEILHSIPNIKSVKVNINTILKKGSLSFNETQTILKENWNKVIDTVGHKSPLASCILSESNWDLNNTDVIININKCFSNYMKERNFKVLIQNSIRSITNLDLIVLWEHDNSSLENKSEDLIEKAIQNTISINNASSSKTSTSANYSSQIIGKTIKDKAIMISEVNEEIPQAVIKGKVIAIDAREIKNHRYIVTIDITDSSNSMTIKFFTKSDIYNTQVKDIIKTGTCLHVRGRVQFDTYMREQVIMAKDIIQIGDIMTKRIDDQPSKRVELHMHTQMSAMDATCDATEIIDQAANWGHEAVAITDHGVVQAFPEAARAAEKHNIKVLYGIEAYIVDDLSAVVQSSKGQLLNDTHVVFDLETTGLKPGASKITEIGAIKIKDGKIIDEFQAFVNPQILIPEKIVKLTGITDNMVLNAPTYDKVLPEFLDFIKDSYLVAHNSNFDMGFIRYFSNEIDRTISNSVVDTLGLARILMPHLKNHKLDTVAEDLGVSLENHHRAVDDAKATTQIYLEFIDKLKKQNITSISEINSLGADNMDVKKLQSYHGIIFAKTQKGLRNLYELVTKSHMKYFYRTPRIPKSEILKHKEGLMLGTACEAGELYKAVLQNSPIDVIKNIIDFYDYLEIQPLKNNQFMIDKEIVKSEKDLKNINKKIVSLGEKYNKPVVATCDTHFLNPQDEVFRRIIMKGRGFSDADNQPPLFFRTTKEMLNEFTYLGKDKAYEVVVTNTQKIANEIDDLIPIPNQTFPPELEGSSEKLVNITYKKANEIYGDPLPDIVQKRLDMEINSIVENEFAVLYIISQKLVWKSLEDGYLVGSRGSVGSSFAATMAGITEVNPLPPHYICPNKNCKYTDFESEIVKGFSGRSGYDMPDHNCPKCNTTLQKEGHDIPFETFLGFTGNKEPDIDLNFSGEYQPRAHQYTEELFGSSHVFKAGTIGTMADRTAFGFVKKYLDEKEVIENRAEVNRLINGCTGVKRTTGQHPGGLMIVPNDNDIHNFSPIQRPANDMESTITTTHFDYHSISNCLLKLDILGHDDPTIIKMLEDLTGIDATKIPFDDPETMSIFTSTKAIGINPEDINCKIASIAVPEFGTRFVRQMLIDTKPTTFSELIRISGLSHGTDVWLNNAQELVRAGTVNLSQVISTRDDIMVYLIAQNIDKEESFQIMEDVRKGRGLTSEQEKLMKDAKVPSWYINSCKKIKYMFPKAHAAAYVMMAFRIAYFKVHYPEDFYATYFTIRAKGKFDHSLMCKGPQKVQLNIEELESIPKPTATEKDTLTVLEVVREMYARDIEFANMDLYKSDSLKFQVTDDGILPPFNSLHGLGDTVAKNIIETRDYGEFISLEQFRKRTKASKTVVEIMQSNNMLQGLPETNQLSFF